MAGDALIVAGDKVMGSKPANTPDMEAARHSVDRLAEQAPAAVVAYHGGPCTSRTVEQLHTLQMGS